MGKKKTKGEYNDFLDGEKLRDNTQVRTSLQDASSAGNVSPPPPILKRGDEEIKSKASDKKKPSRPQLTHFLCLPLINAESLPQLEQSLDDFKKELERDGVVPMKAVRPLGTLHLTLGVMALDKERLEDAGKCLEELDLAKLLRESTSSSSSSSSSSPKAEAERQHMSPSLSIDLKSLVPMQPHPKTTILYATPMDTTLRLYPFACALRSHFASSGFIVDDSRPLKLHATIINTIYAKPRGRRSAQDRSQGHGPNAKSLLKLDARELVDRYEDHVWAEHVRVDRVQICNMGAKKIVDEVGEVIGEEYEEVFGKSINASL
ncbi:hypothetical protein K504DRAFT_435087 [Pleomassaria siparia CBS 279.74]|uniref:A-kinase anchor protein 7-like phosphoesterase domain-containing protein n=1 Tax=Pleomassaria siparia CBS 279.74 TaxID=1314801 RepID=A0A6G1K6U0_9PLEO|nr:hypothetical protein K504DRAFT_435087 [Pleomassaria siparia CBS 279.74]